MRTYVGHVLLSRRSVDNDKNENEYESNFRTVWLVPYGYFTSARGKKRKRRTFRIRAYVVSAFSPIDTAAVRTFITVVVFQFVIRAVRYIYA